MTSRDINKPPGTGIRRRKELMEVSGESWRAYYTGGSEHTSAVLGVADDPQPQSLVTEYYKLPPLAQDTHLNLHKDVWQ
ncbi:jg11529 [Pararge aegeria aegeria]|uniref:Jg11529 protein n=1 Tax=Pararge aegeria aegeria TaxID=348720 RepID=A0A8S4RMQ9_9NEOP|nr:jg11529 [Pararge aegeria aegeria]